MNKIKLFEEFIPISDYKKWSIHTNKKFYDDIKPYFMKFPNHDKNYNRIYFDISIDPKGFNVTVPDEISDYFLWNRIEIVDYNKGICIDNEGRTIKIGKLLRKLGEEDLLKTYNASKTNSLKDISDLQVVISRHPYDIIGMSTNRGWTTCHDLNDKRYGGHHLHVLKSNLERGMLISYLIRKSDRNINNPISRCSINKSYSNLYVDDHVYGTYCEEYVDFLKQWCMDYAATL